ncbi:MAG: hypothetical protein HYR56_12920 [Acidobacteria bacterium]|nr:hypothetical protein [Acidobacteriota bacterium]MBI3427040.1 hypothetical protein [Acidobacteriota bacterium]
MPHARIPSGEIAKRGQLLYEQRIRSAVETNHQGEFLVLDVETGEYEIDASELAAWQRAKEKAQEGAFYFLRIGFPAAYWL